MLHYGARALCFSQIQSLLNNLLAHYIFFACTCTCLGSSVGGGGGSGSSTTGGSSGGSGGGGSGGGGGGSFAYQQQQQQQQQQQAMQYYNTPMTGGGGMFYSPFGGPMYYNAPILPVDEGTLQDYIRKQIWATVCIVCIMYWRVLQWWSSCMYVCMYVFSVCSEYYFSDENLQKDFFLRGQVCVCVCVCVRTCCNILSKTWCLVNQHLAKFCGIV